ncbi:MAG: hypothetical protein NXY57DRAFT_1033997 [Lentinula lateritia]|nr:MAG: hypothetical protein NXY57DRAFT_1033997 [Lentinula lateritia]
MSILLVLPSALLGAQEQAFLRSAGAPYSPHWNSTVLMEIFRLAVPSSVLPQFSPTATSFALLVAIFAWSTAKKA